MNTQKEFPIITKNLDEQINLFVQKSIELMAKKKPGLTFIIAKKNNEKTVLITVIGVSGINKAVVDDMKKQGFEVVTLDDIQIKTNNNNVKVANINNVKSFSFGFPKK